MSGGMPYQIEKGAGLRLIENYINAPRPEMRGMLQVLRDSDQADDLNWITTGLPQLWADRVFTRGPLGSGTAVLEHILRDWFGYTHVGSDWVKDPSASDTGFWIAYRGDVDKIVRRALRWAFEIALGLPPGDDGPGRRRPWQIELFWKCLAPWFETWVVHRPIQHTSTGLVSVFFVTPTHQGANIAESPIATSPQSRVADLANPVPSTQDDYEELGQPHPDPTRPRVPAIQRSYGTWVVTHRRHESSQELEVTNNARATDFAGVVDAADFVDWGIPQLSRYLGHEDIVIVSPSSAAGGVKYDGGI